MDAQEQINNREAVAQDLAKMEAEAQAKEKPLTEVDRGAMTEAILGAVLDMANDDREAALGFAEEALTGHDKRLWEMDDAEFWFAFIYWAPVAECRGCDLTFGTKERAQKHANATGHEVLAYGYGDDEEEELVRQEGAAD